MFTEQSILERLNALEKQNRRMKQIGALVLVIAASLFLMGQTAAKRTVEANEFVLRDSNGAVRSKWFMAKDGPVLSLLDANGQDRVTFEVHAFGGPAISLNEPTGRSGSITIQGPTSSTSPKIILNDARGEIDLSTSGIRIEDKEGFSATVGSTDLVTESTGETHRTSAASVTLFGKDKKVLWRAPGK